MHQKSLKRDACSHPSPYIPGVGGVEPLELVDFVELFKNVSRFEDELVFLNNRM